MSRMELLRRLRGWSQPLLAKRAKVSMATVWRAEDGRPVRPSSLAKLAKALKVPTEAISSNGRTCDRTTQDAVLFGS